MEKIEQTGLITVGPKWKDYNMRGETALKKVVLNPSLDWTQYAPSTERQYLPGFDTLSCTTFSALNDIEMISGLKIEKKFFREENIKWLNDNGYVDENGKVNFSDRYIAILSGTTMLGNNFVSVGDAIIKYGLIPEKDLPLSGSNWNEYMDPKLITPAMLQKGQEFRKRFLPGYEWVFFNYDGGPFDEAEMLAIEEALQYAPIQIAIPVPAHHATSLIRFVRPESRKTFDQYEPFFFDATNADGGVHYGFRYSLEEVPAPEPVTYPQFEFKNQLEFKTEISHPELVEDIKMWQRVLIAEGFLKKGLDTGYFRELTVAATKQFQAKYGISTAGRLGPVTMKKANELTRKTEVIRKPTKNYYIGRNNQKPEAIVIHIMDGTLEGTDAWFNDPNSRVSAHYGIGKTGVVHQYVDEENAAWHAGVVYNPSWIFLRSSNPNFYTIGIEHEGGPKDTWTDETLNASAKLVKEITTRYSIPLDREHVIGHYQINGKKPNCPAVDKGIIQEIINRARML